MSLSLLLQMPWKVRLFLPMSCFLAHNGAYYDTSILYHDISMGNIIISGGGGRGFLIDWDMCVRIGPEAKSPGRVERTVGIFLWS